MDEDKKLRKDVAETREWMIKNNEILKHMRELQEINNKQTSEALNIGYEAKYKSLENERKAKNLKWQIDTNKEDAIKQIEYSRDEFYKYRDDQVQEKKWVLGLAVAAALAILPILLSFYSSVVSSLQ